MPHSLIPSGICLNPTPCRSAGVPKAHKIKSMHREIMHICLVVPICLRLGCSTTIQGIPAIQSFSCFHGRQRATLFRGCMNPKTFARTNLFWLNSLNCPCCFPFQLFVSSRRVSNNRGNITRAPARTELYTNSALFPPPARRS